MKRVGLFFGTFNPVHVGHMIIANHMAQYTPLDEVWLVVTPHNPHKDKSGLLADHHRLALVRIAVEDNPRLRASDVEFHLPQPSYTVHTLAHLSEVYPQVEFALIMGEDNLRSLHKWKNYELILERHKTYVYPRALTEQERDLLKPHRMPAFTAHHPNLVRVEAPVMKLSASFVRQAIADKKDVRYLLTEPVYRYLDEMNFYRK
jgi:nicotinate-nucleotide adenylyltransferase